MNLITAGTHNAMSKIDNQAIFTTAAIDRTLRICTTYSTAQASRLIGTTESNAYPCQQFIKAERLRQVVVGSLVKRLDLDRLFVLRREDDNGRCTPFT